MITRWDSLKLPNGMDLALTTVAAYDIPAMGQPADTSICYGNVLTALQGPIQRANAAHLKLLLLGPVDRVHLPFIQEILRSSPTPFTALEELRVLVRYPDTQPSPENVPQLDLPAKMFPALHTLQVDGACMDWESDIFPQLKEVDLKNCPAVDIWNLMEFTSVLPKWSRLTSLHLTNFLTVTSLESPELMFQDMDEDDFYVCPPSLQELVVDDKICHIAALLWHLDLPGPHASLRLTGHRGQYRDDERSPFTAMLPFDSNLPTFCRAATGISLVIDEKKAVIATRSDHGTLELILPDLELSTPEARALAFRESLSALVDIFATRGAKVTDISLSGDMSAVTEREWEYVFQNLGARACSLHLNNSGSGRRASDLFWALSQHALRGAGECEVRPICPDLKSLFYTAHISSDAPSSLLEAAHSAFEYRHSCQAPLVTVSLHLMVHHVFPETEGLIQSFVQSCTSLLGAEPYLGIVQSPRFFSISSPPSSH